MLTPPVVDGHSVEGESLRVDLVEEAPPAIIFGGVEVEPVLTPARNARVWSYGDVFTVGLRKLDERGRIHVRIQSMAVGLWTSHACWLDAVRQVAQILEVMELHTTRVDIAVDMEGLDVVPALLDFCVGHRGSEKWDSKRGGRQIEIGARGSAKRFMRIYRKDLMDTSTYRPTWERHGYTGGRVVRVEVEFKNGGLPSRHLDYYADPERCAALYGDAVARYRVVTTPENSKSTGVRKASRKSRAVTHPAWLALREGAGKWMLPPSPTWTRRRRLDAARSRVSKALGGLAARMTHRHAEMDDLDTTLAALRALGPGFIEPVTPWRVVGEPQAEGLIESEFALAREATRKRETLLDVLAAQAREEYPVVEIGAWEPTVGQSEFGSGQPGPAVDWLRHLEYPRRSAPDGDDEKPPQ